LGGEYLSLILLRGGGWTVAPTSDDARISNKYINFENLGNFFCQQLSGRKENQEIKRLKNIKWRKIKTIKNMSKVY